MPTQTSVNNEFRNNLTVTKSTAAATAKLSISNTDNTNAASHAALNITTGGASAGDAFMHFSNSVVDNVIGLDNSDSDALVFSLSATPGTTNVARCTTAGEWTYPLQPAFSAYPSGDALNISGDATEYTIQNNTEYFDNNSDFNTGSYTFTAPVTGDYLLGSNVYIYGTDANAAGFYTTITTSNRTYTVLRSRAASSQVMSGQITTCADMDAGDTAVAKTTVSGGAKVADLGASRTIFYGALLQ